MATSLVMTTGLIVLVLGPVVRIGLNPAAEAQQGVQTLQDLGRQGAMPVLDLLGRLPLVGEALTQHVQGLIDSREALQTTLVDLTQRSSGFLQGIAEDTARNLVKVAITLLTVFFLYLHGDAIVAQTRRAANYLGGTRICSYMAPVTPAVNAVLYGLILYGAGPRPAGRSGLGRGGAAHARPAVLGHGRSGADPLRRSNGLNSRRGDPRHSGPWGCGDRSTPVGHGDG
ncbi:AI-2E family transporter [Thiohalorhabdus sp.]|uniref:AI-2E family transporter n=1 Tax=Thiohalorhabdus sp. TaxID=3094134 RepID=UPI002FC3D09E